MSEIEEIKERLNQWKDNPDYYPSIYVRDIQTLLSLLEKALSNRILCPECLQMLEPDGSCLTCRFKEALEKEKENTKAEMDLRIEITGSLWKEKERADSIQEHSNKLGEIITSQNGKRLELEEQIEDWKNGPTKLTGLKYCSIHKTICLPFNGQMACCLESCLKKLRKAMGEHKSNFNRKDAYYPGDKELYKVLEETKSDLKDYTSPSLLVEQLTERIRGLESVMMGDPDHWDSVYVKWATEKAEERIRELEGAIQRAQEDNPDEKHCTCVPLLKVRIKELEVAHQTAGMMINNQQNQIELLEKKVEELESQLASIKADPSKLEIVDGWNNAEEDIYTEQNGKKIEEVK